MTRAPGALVAVVAVAALLTTGGAVGPTNGSGTVQVTAGGVPVAGTAVTLYRFDATGEPIQDFFAGGLSGEDGTLALTDVVAGSYALEFTPPQGSDLLPEWHGGATSAYTSQRVEFHAGGHVSLTEDLAEGGYIEGRIAVDDGSDTPLWVFADRVTPTGVLETVPLDSGVLPDGSFRVGPLPPGRYALRGVAPRGGYVTTWWPAAVEPARAGTVTVHAGRTRTGVGVHLSSRTATLGGEVTANVGGEEIPSRGRGSVDLITRDGHVVADGTIAEGRWSVLDVPPGTYRVRFSMDAARNPLGLADEYWADAARAASAQTVTVRAGESRSIPIMLDALPTPTASLERPAAFARAGDVLEARVTVPSRSQAEITYQWYQQPFEAFASIPRTPIPGATGRTLRITSAHGDSAVSVVATVTMPGHAPARLGYDGATRVLDGPATGVLPDWPW